MNLRFFVLCRSSSTCYTTALPFFFFYLLGCIANERQCAGNHSEKPEDTYKKGIFRHKLKTEFLGLDLLTV